jgi:DNA polymerase III epsilon subunit-like protein
MCESYCFSASIVKHKLVSTMHKNLACPKTATPVTDTDWMSKDRTMLVGTKKLSGVKIVAVETCTLDHFDKFPLSKSKATKALKSEFTKFVIGDYFGLTVYCWSNSECYVIYQPDGFVHHLVNHEEVIEQVEFVPYGTSQEEIEAKLSLLAESKDFVIDTETHGTDLDPDGGLSPYTGELRYLQIWGDAYPNKVLIFDFGNRNQTKEYSKVSDGLQRLVLTKTVIFHNALFDMQWLSEKLGISWDTCKIRDTGIISRLCWSGIPAWVLRHTLGAVAERVEISCHNKEFQKDDFGVDAVLPAHLTYGAMDVVTTKDVFYRFQAIYSGKYLPAKFPELRSVIRLQNAEIQRTQSCLLSVLAMRMSGFPVDTEILASQIITAQQCSNDAEKEISPYVYRYYCLKLTQFLKSVVDFIPESSYSRILELLDFWLNGGLEFVEFTDSSDLLVEIIHELHEVMLPTNRVEDKKTGEMEDRESSDDASIKILENEYAELAWLKQVRKFRGAKKRIDYLDSIKRSIRYIAGMPRCFCAINPYNPQASGRFSGNKYTKVFGLNLYNSPKPNPEFPEFPVVRKCFQLTKTNYSFAVCDLAASHAQIGLEISGQFDVLKDMNEGKDAHAGTAILISQMTGGEYSTEDLYYAGKERGDVAVKTLRNCAKTSLYSSLNLCSPRSLVASLAEVGIFKDESECELILAAVWKRIPKIKKMVFSLANESIDSVMSIDHKVFGFEENPRHPIKWCPVVGNTGRLRYFSAYFNDRKGRLSVKAPEVASHAYASVESTIMIVSGDRFYREVVVGRPRLKAEIVMQLYDELVAVAPNEYIDEVARRLNEIIKEEWERYIKQGKALSPNYKDAIVIDYSLK